MNFLIYVIIFLSKVLENALATLRLILEANGKKFTGAILQLVIAVVWVIVTGSVLVDITKDPLKVLFFGLGSMVGSFLGSYIEEKMAIGSNAVTAVVDFSLGEEIANNIRLMGFAATISKGYGKDSKKGIIYIVISRKRQRQIIDLIKVIDSNAMIISSNTSSIHGGLVH